MLLVPSSLVRGDRVLFGGTDTGFPVGTVFEDGDSEIGGELVSFEVFQRVWALI